ncbi:hypothetical protein TAGGR_2365 [Thermodesulfovibrio aggregans]|uniref:DUF5666 domain-containing protein n=1 Tax=Thermodesulfovibrio aggregans TaxID=86166 RepID=A0A0U9HR12_9BACT|nr:hypothetical protein [Thermodesulfovibrio aggregans]GAQ95472.1 hypothetical protein TAGGR_2365 [Thermodesulfovibrio aggregans]
MNMLIKLLIILSTIIFFNIAFAEDYKGNFEVKGNSLIINKHRRIILNTNIEVLTSTGQKIPIENLKYARVIEIVRDSGNNIVKIIVLGWWD